MKNFCYLSIIIKPYRIGASSNRNLLTNRLHDRKGSDSVFGYKVSTLNSGFITLRLRDKIWTFLYRIYVWRVNTKRISDQNVSDSSRIRKLLLWCKSSLNDVVRTVCSLAIFMIKRDILVCGSFMEGTTARVFCDLSLNRSCLVCLCGQISAFSLDGAIMLGKFPRQREYNAFL